MKRAIVVVMMGAAALYGAAASAAVGGSYRLAWGACPGSLGSSAQTNFSCDPKSAEAETLFVTFALDSGIVGTRLEVILDFHVDGPEVPPFWQFHYGGGCNESGIALSARRPAPVSVACGGVVSQLCDNSGACCISDITAYAFGPPVNLPPNDARMFVTITRTCATVATLDPSPTEQFGFGLQFFMDNASTPDIFGCPGCERMVGIALNTLVVYDTPGGGPRAAIRGGGHANFDPDVCVNCPPVATTKCTWGRLKALYR